MTEAHQLVALLLLVPLVAGSNPAAAYFNFSEIIEARGMIALTEVT